MLNNASLKDLFEKLNPVVCQIFKTRKINFKINQRKEIKRTKRRKIKYKKKFLKKEGFFKDYVVLNK